MRDSLARTWRRSCPAWARVTVYDPAALHNARGGRPDLGYAGTSADAAQSAHVVLLLTEWPGFTALMPDSLEGTIARHKIIDARSVLGRARGGRPDGSSAPSGWRKKQHLPGGWAPPAGRRLAGSACAVPLVRDQLAYGQ